MSLKFLENIDISKYTTMRVGGRVKFLVTVDSIDQLREALNFAYQKNLNFFVLGGGSNTIFTEDGFAGLIIINKIIMGSEFELKDETIAAGSGSRWDDLVGFSVDNNLTGIEALSLIPGSVGAASVQNIGAYGQQISDSVLELSAFDTKNNQIVKFKSQDCNFAYRRSRFNLQDKGRFIIIGLKLKLKKGNYQGKLYQDVENYFQNLDLIKKEYSPLEIRQAIISIRQKKMPDPTEFANAGSFFKNPIISIKEFEKLKIRSPSILLPPSGWTQPPYWQVIGRS
jgi:UDP-N-acetylmuramate dehydrogenase